ILSVTLRALDASNPRPTAGKIKTLLHWAISILFAPYFTGANGDPVATSARPSVQAMRSEGSASERLVGVDKGKMIGRSVLLAISGTIDSAKIPLTVDKPINMVASTLAITSAKPTCPCGLRGQSTISLRSLV